MTDRIVKCITTHTLRSTTHEFITALPTLSLYVFESTNRTIQIMHKYTEDVVVLDDDDDNIESTGLTGKVPLDTFGRG